MGLQKKIFKFEYEVLSNCLNLVSASESLFEQDFFPAAYFLAYTAFEEFCKLTSVLHVQMNIVLNNVKGSDQLDQLFKSKIFQDHRIKLRAGFLRVPGFPYKKTVKAVDEMIRLRERSLYVDLHGGSVLSPTIGISKTEAEAMIMISNNSLNTYMLSPSGKRIELSEKTVAQWNTTLEKGMQEHPLRNNVPDDEDFTKKLSEILTNEETFNHHKRISGLLQTQ